MPKTATPRRSTGIATKDKEWIKPGGGKRGRKSVNTEWHYKDEVNKKQAEKVAKRKRVLVGDKPKTGSANKNVVSSKASKADTKKATAYKKSKARAKSPARQIDKRRKK